MLEVIPGIFEQELSEIEHKVDLVAPYVESVQIDFADGQLVPTTSFLDVEKLKPLIDSHPHLAFEAHLMVASPEKFIKPLVDAGFKRIIAHVEANDPRIFLEEAEYESVETGIAIDGATELDQVEPLLDGVDVVLVMMAEAGEHGVELQLENVEKIRAIREGFPDLPIESEEGITDKTATVIKDAGATRIVVTKYLFDKGPEGIAACIEQLKQL